MLDRGVVHHQVGDDPDAAFVRRIDERLEVVDGAVVGMDGVEVRDVVAAVTQRRRVHRQQPHAVHAEPLQVVEPLGEPDEVADAVVVAVGKGADVDLVEHRALEPRGIGLEPLRPDAGFVGDGELTPDRGQAPDADELFRRAHSMLITCASPGGSRT